MDNKIPSESALAGAGRRKPNPHDRLMERAWRHCREGTKLCQKYVALRQKTYLESTSGENR